MSDVSIQLNVYNSNKTKLGDRVAEIQRLDISWLAVSFVGYNEPSLVREGPPESGSFCGVKAETFLLRVKTREPAFPLLSLYESGDLLWFRVL
jgi:hypothetical protein